jgi:hypothetical protein
VVQLQRAGTVNPFYPKVNFYIGRAHFLAGNNQLALEAASARLVVTRP